MLVTRAANHCVSLILETSDAAITGGVLGAVGVVAIGTTVTIIVIKKKLVTTAATTPVEQTV